MEPQTLVNFAGLLSFLGLVLSPQALGFSKFLLYQVKQFSFLLRVSSFISKAGPSGCFPKLSPRNQKPIVDVILSSIFPPLLLLSTFYTR